MVWLISRYVLYVWYVIHVKGADVKLEQFFGYLTFKFKEYNIFSSIAISTYFQLMLAIPAK